MADVTVQTLDGVAMRITAGRHELVADEPEPVGEDRGPDPYALLLSALGACTAITVTLYARRKGWPLESVTIRLSHAKVHAADCEEAETKVGMLDHVQRDVEFRGPLSEEQRARLLDIATKCPVHRTLESEIVIETHLSEPGSSGVSA